MKFKKCMGFLLASVMSISLLAGCGGSGDKNAEQSSKTTEDKTTSVESSDTQAAKTSEAEGEIEINLWHHWQSEQRRPTITAIVDKFNEENAGKIKVVSTPIPWSDFDALLMAAIASGDVPDVVVRPLSNYVDYAENEMVEDMTSYLDPNVLDKYSDNFKSYAQHNNKIYSLPFSTDDYIVYYNKKIFADAGVTELPTTWDQMLSIADKIDKKNDKGEYEVISFFPGLPNGIFNLMDANGGGIWDNPSLPTAITFNSEKNIEALEFAKKWSDRYGADLWKKFASIMNQNVATETNDIFVQGKVAMIIEASNYAKTVTKYGPDMEVGAFPIPAGPSADGKDFVTGGGFSLYVPKGSKHVEAAAKFADFMTDDWASTKWGVDQVEIMANKSVKDAPELQSNELFKVALSVAPKIVSGPALKGLTDRRSIEDQLRDSTMGSSESAKVVADRAQEEAINLLEQSAALDN